MVLPEKRNTIMKLTFKIILLLFFLAVAAVAINPLMMFQHGVLVKSVESNSSAYNEGLTQGEIITAINGYPISSLADFSNATSYIFNLSPVNFKVEVLENNALKDYNYSSLTLGFDVDDNLTIINSNFSSNSKLVKINNKLINSTTQFNEFRLKNEPKVKLSLTTNKGNHVFFASKIDFTVSEIPKSNLKAGLDLQGGAKALVRPEKKLTSSEMADLIRVTKERLNVYGIADIVVRSATDLSGNTYMVVEVAGATPKELQDLIGQQGKFEAKIGNETVFIGGKKQITSVCKNDPSCAAIRACQDTTSGSYCTFDFVIYLSEEAAKKQANVTGTLGINITPSGDRILSKNFDLYLDDKLVDTLQISSDLKGKVTTSVSIRGSGTGKDKTEAYAVAEANMARLQTVLITGSLPYKLEIVKLDSISPLLGKQFVDNILLAALAAAIGVALVVFIRYRKLNLTLPIILTVLSEIFIILGMAALIRWNLDLASIAGIIAAIGTGVDAQVIIIDESRKTHEYSMKERIKRAFFIILGSFSTVFVAMLPLFWAGAGMMKGFALTTILGACIGVFITRPAFADIINQTVKDEVH
jgi:preprotein translocase subunit SecD